MRSRPSRGRLLVGALAVLLTLGAVLERTHELAVERHLELRALAEANRKVAVPLPAERGSIVDRAGRPVAQSVEQFVLKVVPAEVAPHDPLLERICRALGIDPAVVEARLRMLRAQTPREPRTIYGPLTHTDAMVLGELLGFEGQSRVAPLQVGVEMSRVYPYGELLAGVTGYIGRIDTAEHRRLRAQGYRPDDLIGKSGVEAVYERELRGVPGYRVYERDALGRLTRMLEEHATVPGATVRLSIDIGVQKRLADEIDSGIAKGQFRAGGAALLDPNDGAVLALVSRPSYDPNAFVRGITAAEWQRWSSDPARPLIDRSYAEHYPPGSTFKSAVAAAALQEGVARRDTRIHSAGGFQYGNFYFRDWTAHGWLDLIGGLAHSSDVYFYVLSGGSPDGARAGLGDRLPPYAQAFGFGRPTGVDLTGEASGIIGDRERKAALNSEGWSRADEYFMGIGQGLTAVTPLQMARFYAAIANGGALHQPRVGPRAPAAAERLPVDPEHLRTVREGLRAVVTSGHAYMRTTLKVAGKTGTAEFGEAAPGKPLPFHNWFVSYLPRGGTADPLGTDHELAMSVFLYETSAGCGDRPVCMNPAIALTERFYDWYIGERPLTARPGRSAP